MELEVVCVRRMQEEEGQIGDRWTQEHATKDNYLLSSSSSSSASVADGGVGSRSSAGEFGVAQLRLSIHRLDGGGEGGEDGGGGDGGERGAADGGGGEQHEPEADDGRAAAAHLPLLGAAAEQPAIRAVLQPVRDFAAELMLQENSDGGFMFGFYMSTDCCELLASIPVLAVAWGKACDKPLRWFNLLSAVRLLVLLPLAIIRYRRRHIPFDVEHPDGYYRWQLCIRALALLWAIVGHYWWSTCDCSRSALYANSLFLIQSRYFQAVMPLLVWLYHRLVRWRRGGMQVDDDVADPEPEPMPPPAVSKEVIAALPKRTWCPPPEGRPGVEGAPNHEPPSCAICAQEYKPGDELQIMPCQHEMHAVCLDRWLSVKASCPYCRRSVDGDDHAEEGGGGGQGGGGSGGDGAGMDAAAGDNADYSRGEGQA